VEGVHGAHEVALRGAHPPRLPLLQHHHQLPLHLPHHDLGKVGQHRILGGIKAAGLEIKHAQSAVAVPLSVGGDERGAGIEAYARVVHHKLVAPEPDIFQGVLDNEHLGRLRHQDPVAEGACGRGASGLSKRPGALQGGAGGSLRSSRLTAG
jgi:hypothetical protein